MKKYVLFIIAVVISIALLVFSYIVLPQQVIIQVRMDGKATNVVPKLLAIAIPFFLSVFGGTLYSFGNEENKKKHLILLIVGLILPIITIFMNR